MSEIKKLDLRSMDIIREQKEKLRQLFPEVLTEKKIDFEKLKLALGEAIEVGKERYGMTWPGKADCFKIIQSSSIGMLKPCREESVHFDTTENLFIEGDNLEVLKLLQKSYYGKVKMIYIDPPYNTGNDFIYPDDYKENLKTYLQYTGQVDGQGKKFSTNTDTEGRFHSKWLNMMYPRLFLAKNLLSEDGIIFISIDDNEVDNLRKILNEIFGEENFFAQIIVQSNKRGQTYKQISKTHEYIIVYTENIETELNELEKNTRNSDLNLQDDIGPFSIRELRNRNPKFGKFNRPNLFYQIYIDPKKPDKNGFCPISLTKDDKFFIEVLPLNSAGNESCWRWGTKLLKENINLNTLKSNIVAKAKRNGNFNIYEKYRKTTYKPKSIWDETGVITEQGTIELGKLGLSKYFDFPKPTYLIKKMLQIGTKEDSIVLDFFAGSCTTAHAIMDLNSQDGGSRKFICIQLPEFCGEGSAACKEGLKTIAEIGKERIRRVIKNIEKETDETLFNNKKIDLGFKVFKLDKSNFKIWDSEKLSLDKKSLEKQLELHIDHINYKASQGDILYEILLKAGFELTTKIEKIELAGKAVYSIEGGVMLICLEKELTKEVMKAMAEKQPSRVICLDQGFANNDQLKTNAVQIMKSKGVDDFRTV